jgi:hypothetical protein
MNARRAVAAVCLLSLASGCGAARSTTSSTGSSAALASATPLPWVAATVPAGYPTEAFRVAAPDLMIPAGPAAIQQTPCKRADVSATAATMLVADGVAGVIHLQGKACSLHITSGPTALLDAEGKRLPIALVPTTSGRGQIGDPRPDALLAAGDVLWGFAWRGSWCGARPTSVLVPMRDDAATSGGTASYGDLQVLLSGPAPACHGRSKSMLQPGVAGSPTEAVLPPPPAWAGLRLSLRADSTIREAMITGLTLTVRNRTGSPIALSPCPAYFLVISNATANGGSEDASGSGQIACGHRVLAPHASATYPLPDQTLDEGTPGGVAPGTEVTLQVAIAGVPTAKTTTRVG